MTCEAWNVGKLPEGARVVAAPNTSTPMTAQQIEDIVVRAMDDAWDDFVMDTNCFPDDFTLRGRSLGFKAGRWAHFVGQIVAKRLAGPAGVEGRKP